MPTPVSSSPEPRRQPSTQRGRDRRAQQLRVACEQFLLGGYDSVSLDAIVAQAGGSKAAIYNHFGNKDALFFDVIAFLCEEFLAKLRAIDIGSPSLEAGLRSILQELVDVITAPRHVAFYRLVVAGSARFPQAGRTWYENGPVVCQGVIMQLFDEQQRKGQIAGDAPKAALAAVLFDALLSNLTTQVVILGLPADKDFASPIVEELVVMACARLKQGGAEQALHSDGSKARHILQTADQARALTEGQSVAVAPPPRA